MLLSHACEPSVTFVNTTSLWFCRDHTLQTLDGVYAARTELNLEAVRLMIPQVNAVQLYTTTHCLLHCAVTTLTHTTAFVIRCFVSDSYRP